LGQVRGHGTKFGRKQEEAIAALLTQRSIDEAAKAIGVSSNTLYRWMEVPEFQAAYRKARFTAVQQAIARLQQATGAAAITLLKLMTDVNAPAAVRLRAAECVLERSMKGIELEDIDARLTELERAVEQSGKH
jgi:transposase-like protein